MMCGNHPTRWQSKYPPVYTIHWFLFGTKRTIDPYYDYMMGMWEMERGMPVIWLKKQIERRDYFMTKIVREPDVMEVK